MAQLSIPTEPAPGVTINQNDDKITITITTTPPSDDRTLGQDARALWHAAYSRLREEHTEELTEFEGKARVVFRLLQRSNSSNAQGRSVRVGPGWHNMEANTVLGVLRRWISEGETESDEEDREDEVRRALSSTKTLLSRNIQESPSAHLAWVAASLCIQRLVQESRPISDTPGLAYIVARIAFYDRLSQLAYNAPVDDKDGDSPLRKVIVDLYTAVLKQLILVLALGHGQHGTRAQQQKTKHFDRPNVAVGSADVHPVIALESCLGQHARDKALEESIAELVRLRAPALSLPDGDDTDTLETASDRMKADDDHVYDDYDDNTSHGHVDDHDEDVSDDDYTDPDHPDNHSSDASSHNDIQRLLCVAPVLISSLQPPLPLPPDQFQNVLDGLYHWASEQDAYRRWRKARSTDDAPSDDRILWLHGQQGPSMTMLLSTLTQAEAKNRAGEKDGALMWHALTVARASWDWTRDVRGTSVVSVVRDLIWSVLESQPTLQCHLEQAVRATDRWPLLGGDLDSEARYAALGTSCDFYAMLVLLCRIVRDEAFEPTCFVVDYMPVDVLLGDDDHVDAGTAQKRAWTPRDLMALMRTTCRLSGKVAWIVSLAREVNDDKDLDGDGGCHLRVHLPPADEAVGDAGDNDGADMKLGKIMRDYVRARLQCRPTPTYTQDMLDQLSGELTRRAGGNVAWSTLVVDVLARVRLPWNATHVLKRLPDGNSGLGSLLDWIIRDNVGESNGGNANDQTLVDVVLHAAALSFRPLTVPELIALAELPDTVDVDTFIAVLAWPLLEVRDADNGRGKSQEYVYFSSQTMLAAQYARLAKATAAPDLHADMVCRHIRHLARHYGDAGRGQLSPYMKLAWLRHLDRASIARTSHSSLTENVCNFVERNARAWLRDLDKLGIVDVARRMLQDLLPPGRQQRQLSPLQKAIETLLSRIVNFQVLGMSLADSERFRHLAGYNSGEEEDDYDSDLPVLPQLPPMPLPDSPGTAEAAAPIATLEGHDDWVRDTKWAYEGRLIVSISDDDTLRCWDRASCRLQHVADHTLQQYPSQIALSPEDPSMLVAMGSRSIVRFDLACGAVVPRSKRSHYDIMEEWQRKHNKDAAAEDLGWFDYMRFAEDGSNDLIVTCVPEDDRARELVLGMPGLYLRDDRLITLGYKSLPTKLADSLSESECRDVVVADNMGLAAVVRDDGDVVIYNSRLAERQLTLHRAQSAFSKVRYVPLWRMFLIHDDGSDSSHAMFHFVHERGEDAEQGEREAANEPLIRSYLPPRPDMLSYAFSPARDEVVFTYKSGPTSIYKVIEVDEYAGNNADHVDGTPDTCIMRDETLKVPEPFTSTLFSHDGLRAATSNNMGQVRLWDLPNMATSEREVAEASGAKVLHTMESTDSEINWLSFSSNDALLLACYDNGQTAVWDTDTGKRVAVMGRHRGWVRFAAFSPGDELVATASYYPGALRLWDLKACREAYIDSDGAMAGCFVEEDSMSEDSKSEDSKSHDDDNNTLNNTTPPIKGLFVALEGAAGRTPGSIAFSPDGRFLATSGRLGRIWDISPDPESDSILPTGPLLPCATLHNEDTPTQKREEGRKRRHSAAGDGDDNDTASLDDDYNTNSSTADLDCYSFVFSPDSRSLFGFCSDGRLFFWKRTPSSPSSPSSSLSNSEHWEPRATVLAHGFAVPGQDRLWTHLPRRLSISEDTDGKQLLHTEIGVWVLPSLPTGNNIEKVGLLPSPHHPCNIVDTDTHMAILWQNRLLAKIPRLYAPTQTFYFSSYTCDVRAATGGGSTLIIGTNSAHLLYFNFKTRK